MISPSFFDSIKCIYLLKLSISRMEDKYPIRSIRWSERCNEKDIVKKEVPIFDYPSLFNPNTCNLVDFSHSASLILVEFTW